MSDEESHLVNVLALTSLHLVQDSMVEPQHVFWETVELCSEVGKVVTQGPPLQQFFGNESDPQKYPLGLLRDTMSELTIRIRLSQGKTGFPFPVAITQSVWVSASLFSRWADKRSKLLSASSKGFS